MLILNGKEVASRVRSVLVHRIQEFAKKTGRPPHLSVVIVGNDSASHVYVKNKKIACEAVGMSSTIHNMPEDTSQAELTLLLQSLNTNKDVDGVLVQFPLPKHLSEDKVLNLVAPEKDADGLTYASLGYFFAGRPLVKPCTPEGVMKILKHYDISLTGLKAVVVGRSNIVGKPMAQLLTESDATVTICHSKTKDLSAYTREADLVVVAAGKPRLLGKHDFKKDAIVIDVGVHRNGSDGKLCGDVRYEELDGWVKAATPVPGGVGPMTIATLIENTCELAEKRLNAKG